MIKNKAYKLYRYMANMWFLSICSPNFTSNINYRINVLKNGYNILNQT